MTSLNPTSKPDGLPELPLKNDDDFKKLEELLSIKTVDGGREIPGPAYTYLIWFKILLKITSTFVILKQLNLINVQL